MQIVLYISLIVGHQYFLILKIDDQQLKKYIKQFALYRLQKYDNDLRVNKYVLNHYNNTNL